MMMAALLLASSLTALRLVAPSGWRSPPLAARCRGPRASADGEAVDIPRDLRQLSSEARGAMRSAALSGVRGMLIDAAVPTLDPALKAFQPPLLARLAVECARELRSLVSLRADAAGGADLGRVVVLVPGLACAVEANKLASGGEEEEKWRRAQAAAGRTDASGRIEVTSLGMAVEPAGGDPPPAAVAVVGLLPSSDSDDKTVAIARQWLRLASGLTQGPANTTRPPPPLTLGLNLRCGALREVSEFVTVCALVPYAIVRRSKPAGPISLGKSTVEQAKVLLFRVHPDPFRVLLAPPGGDGAAAIYSEVVAVDQRPTMDRIADLVESRVSEMQSRAEAAVTPEGGRGARGAGVKAGEEEKRLAAQRALASLFTSMEWDAPPDADASTDGSTDGSPGVSKDVSGDASRDAGMDVPTDASASSVSGDASRDRTEAFPADGAADLSPAAAAASAASAAGLSIVTLSYGALDDEMRLYASASALRMSGLGSGLAYFGKDAAATHLLARLAEESVKPDTPRHLAAAVALLRYGDTGGGDDTGGGGDAYLEQLAVAPGAAAQRSLCASAVIARAVCEAAAAGAARLVAPAEANGGEAGAWFAAAGMEQEQGVGWVRRIR